MNKSTQQKEIIKLVKKYNLSRKALSVLLNTPVTSLNNYLNPSDKRDAPGAAYAWFELKELLDKLYEARYNHSELIRVLCEYKKEYEQIVDEYEYKRNKSEEK